MRTEECWRTPGERILHELLFGSSQDSLSKYQRRDRSLARLKHAILASGKRLNEIAKEVGMSRPNLSNIQTGRVLLTEERIPAMATALGVSESWLRGD